MKLYNGATVLNVSEMPQGNINAEKGQIYLLQGDSYDWLKKIPENSIDSVVCDPPYLLNFMGKEFDRENGNPADHVEFWKLVLKTMKPGAHLLAAGIGRTHHRVMVAIEDAGFEIRDCIYHVFGSGFTKSHNIGKSVDKLQGNEREVLGQISSQDITSGGLVGKEYSRQLVDVTKGTSPYEGWGTALKPAVEIWTLARKPLSESTVALNVIKWGTGGINIDGCRVGTDELKKQKAKGSNGGEAYGDYNLNAEYVPNTQGRFPANFIHDGSDEVVGLFPESNSGNGKAKTYEKEGGQWGKGKQIRNAAFGDSGSASRFFYCAKASKRDRNEGLPEGETSTHPTVKPTSLMQYLVRLVTPKGGTVLDPFMGSGSTGKACVLEGFDFIGIEKDPEYCKIAEARIEYAVGKP